MDRCDCLCHWDRRLPRSAFKGVDITNPVEALTACTECQWCHYIEPATTDDGEGDEA